MHEYFLKRDAEDARKGHYVSSCCLKCCEEVNFPAGVHDGYSMLCPVCGEKVELRNTLGIQCPHCLCQVCARERDIGKEFKCPACGDMVILTLADIDFEDGQTHIAFHPIQEFLKYVIEHSDMHGRMKILAQMRRLIV